MRIAYFGLPLGAYLLCVDGHEVHAFIRDPNALGMRRLKRLAKSVAVVREADATHVRAIRPELIVSWFWVRKLPKDVLSIAPAIGVHPSLLPRWRGPDPFFWAIATGDDVTGVTAHVLEEEYDTGAILGRRELRIDPAWNAWRLALMLDRPSLELLRETVRAYAHGSPPKPEPQDESRVTLAPDPDDLEIRWSHPAIEIERFVRAAAPWPGAFTEIAGETIAITKTRIVAAPKNLAPGEALVRDGQVVVKAAEGALALLEGRREADEVALDSVALARLL